MIDNDYHETNNGSSHQNDDHSDAENWFSDEVEIIYDDKDEDHDTYGDHTTTISYGTVNNEDQIQGFEESLNNDNNVQATDDTRTMQDEQTNTLAAIPGASSTSSNVTFDQHMDDQYGSRSSHYNLHPRKEHNYSLV